MVHQKTWALVGALAWLEVGCARTVVRSEDVGTGNDAGPGGDAPLGMATSRTYIISAYDIPGAPDAMNRVPGFNLDGVNSNGMGSNCVGVTEDFTSLTGEAGTDNQLVGTLTALFASGLGVELQSAANQPIASGTQLLAVRVSDVESFTTDASVTIELFLVRQADCARETCPVVSGVMPDGAWVQRASALTPPVPAAIAGGQLRGSLPTFPLALNPGTGDTTLTLREVTSGADITAAGLSAGAIGGLLTPRDVLDFCEQIMPGIEETVVPIIAGMADIEPTPRMADVCRAISAGIGFRAVSARSVTR